jgi:hypothetical protein
MPAPRNRKQVEVKVEVEKNPPGLPFCVPSRRHLYFFCGPIVKNQAKALQNQIFRSKSTGHGESPRKSENGKI